MVLRVYPWEIGTEEWAVKLESGECRVKIGGEGYEIWWQKHPEKLIFAFVRTESGAGRALEPGAKTVVTYLVYDIHRNAIISIYGTALDSRPFVEAFSIGLKEIIKERETV